MSELQTTDIAGADRKGITAMPNPTPEMLAGDPLFDAIWSVIKHWDVNVPEYYGGYCGANGSHATLIYNAVKQLVEEPRPASASKTR